MSYPADERHEREMVGASQPTSRIPPEKEKPDKPKGLSSQGGTVHDTGIYQRQHQTNKPLQNLQIAPAAGAMPMSLANQFPPSFGSGSTMQSYGLPVHAMMGHGQMPRAPMVMSAMPHQHAFVPHVPRGPAAAALAGAAPRSASALRKPTVSSSSKPQGIAASQAAPQASTVPSQVHASVSTSSSQSQAPVLSSVQRLVASVHQQSLEPKQSDMQDVRPAGVTDKPRRIASPHVQSSSVHSAVSSHQTSAASKPGTVTSSVSLNTTSQKAALLALPMAVHHSQGPVAVSSSGLLTSLPSSSTTGPSVMTQSKYLPSTAISVTPVLSLGKGYPAQHPAAFQARQPMPTSEIGLAGDHGRLGKPSGTASPISVSTHHVGMMSTAPLASTAQSTVVGSDNRMDRPYPSIPIPSQFTYPGLYYSDSLSGYPHATALRQFPQFPPSFTSLPSIVRTPQATTAAAAAAAHVAAAAAAAGVNPMLVDPRFLGALQQQGAGALGYIPAGMGALGVDSSAASSIMDGNIAASIYSGSPLLGLSQPANLQAQISSANPNATSPRPSILRKRTSEGMRKPVCQLSELSSASHLDAAASPKSESTVSAPRSAQNSPKPASDPGSKAAEQSLSTTSKGTNTITIKAEHAKVLQPQPVSPSKIKRELNDSLVLSSTSVKSNGVNSFLSSSVHLPPSIAAPADGHGASPRKKPRKQNVVATEDKYGSSVVLEGETTDEESKKAKQDADDELKFIILKRPKISIFGGYKVNTKAAHNHFQKYSDVKVKEERRLSMQDVANSKGIVQRANGWRIQHCAAQIDELAQVEEEVLKKMCDFREKIPKPKPGLKTKLQDELGVLHELLQGNIQRSQLVIEQLGDSRKSMTRVLDHQPKVVDLLSKFINKRNPKKKS